MRVAAQAVHVELDVEQALAAQAKLRPPLHIEARALPQAGVRRQALLVRRDDVLEGRAAHLSFALDDPLEPDGQLAPGREQPVNRTPPPAALPLLIPLAAG